mmetsp:Transcript_11963/g.39772  ORF Transcript_11963/g.39772 Transcript_11963/m.39772 type:complete len:220 (-) Transcript_11963:1735-2394(-)
MSYGYSVYCCEMSQVTWGLSTLYLFFLVSAFISSTAPSSYAETAGSVFVVSAAGDPNKAPKKSPHPALQPLVLIFCALGVSPDGSSKKPFEGSSEGFSRSIAATASTAATALCTSSPPRPPRPRFLLFVSFSTVSCESARPLLLSSSLKASESDFPSCPKARTLPGFNPGATSGRSFKKSSSSSSSFVVAPRMNRGVGPKIGSISASGSSASSCTTASM